MAPIRLLVRRNLRKRKGQVAAVVVLTTLAALLLNLGFLMAVRYPTLIEDRFTVANAEDATGLFIGTGHDRLAEHLGERDGVTQLEVERVLAGQATLGFNHEPTSTIVSVFSMQHRPAMGRWTVAEESATPVADPIYAPSVFRGAGYHIGDAMTLTTPHGRITRRIQGFLELPTLGMMGTGNIGFGVPTDADLTTLAGTNALEPASLVKLRLKDSEDMSVFSTELAGWNKEHADAPVASPWWILTSNARNFAALGSNIFAGALTMFSLVVGLVIIVVMRFLIANTLSDETRHIGALRASGYTTGRVVAQLTGTHTACAMVGTVLGIGLSQLAVPVLARTMSHQTGLIWHPGFDVVSAVLVLGILVGVVVVTAAVAASSIRRLSTLETLHGGHRTHEFRHNPLPLSSSPLVGLPNGLSTALGLKTATQRLRQSLTLGLTILVVTFSTVVAIGMAVNLNSPDVLRQFTVGDIADSTFVVKNQQQVAQVVATAQSLPGVESAVPGGLSDAVVNDAMVLVHRVPDYSVVRHDYTYEGRFPRHPNEVVLGKPFAEHIGASVGDTVTLRMLGRTSRFIVTGLSSTSRMLGMSIDVTTEGFARLNPDADQEHTVVIRTRPGVDTQHVIDQIVSAHKDAIVSTQNDKASIDSQLLGYTSMVNVLSTTVIVLMTTIAALVLSLMVATLVNQSRSRFGVLKALGHTNRDLAVQTQLTHLPALAAGAVTGALLGWWLLNPTLALMLRSIGVMKAEFSLPTWFGPALAVTVVGLAALVIWGASRGLARISPSSLVTSQE